MLQIDSGTLKTLTTLNLSKTKALAVDAEGVKDDNLHSFNRYAYGNNNPFRYIDPDGRYAEDLALGIPSLAIGAKSFVDNVRAGNWGSATVDVAGMMKPRAWSTG